MMKPQSRALLIFDWRYGCTVRGVEWITCGATLARVEMFKRPPETELFAAAGVRRKSLVAIDAAAWDTWIKTGLTPTLNVNGAVLRWGQVRGERALYGLVNGVRVHGLEP